MAAVSSPAASPAFSILLLTENEAAASVDKTTFRRLGIPRVRRLSSGRDAMAFLALQAGDGEYPAAIVCEERLADMNGIEFLHQLRSLADTASLPVVFLVSDTESPLAIAAQASSSCAVLSRPYTQDEASAALALANRPENLRAPLPLPETLIPFKSAASHRESVAPAQPRSSARAETPRPAGIDLYQAAFVALREGDARNAEKLLARCYAENPLHSEACLALNRLCIDDRREGEARTWLCRAAISFLRQRDPDKAHELFARLFHSSFGANALIAEAASLLREMEYRTAARTFIDAHRAAPEIALHAMVSRACLFTPAPEEALAGVCAAMAAMGHGSTASRLQLRLSFAGPSPREEDDGRFLDRFPRLQEIMNVATYTFSAWRKAV